ncbi:MAG: hypothetical protein WD793_13825 [Steroidobacteraceae bacterium]
MPADSNVTPLHRGIIPTDRSEVSCRQYTWTANRRARLSELAPITLPRGTVPLQGYANYSTRELAPMCGISKGTAQRWRKTGRAPAIYVVLLELLHRGPLGLISHEWADWCIRKGKLCNTDGHEYTPGEVWSIPLLHQRIAALEATIRELRAAAEIADCFDDHRGRSHREFKAIGKAEALSRVVFSLLRDLTESEDGYPPALGGDCPAVRQLQIASSQVFMDLFRGTVSSSTELRVAMDAALTEFERPVDV